ncbi:hypothetical protein [Streptomyces sp. NPDC057740]|uniref:hypothetical protein n=1 Tax=Streptomyces sp. NPDC057740 TaxID=3346234 RepID=UPI003685CDA5
MHPRCIRRSGTWIRLGTNDSDTSHTVSANLAAAADGRGDDVSHLSYWDEGHGANSNPGDFIAWDAKVSGYQGKGAGRRATR